MSGFDNWFCFFEEPSEKRDIASWWRPISEKVLSWGMEIIGLVSDRAIPITIGIVKLGASAYLGVCSIPDLFHFTQDLGQLLGMQLGKKRAQALKCLKEAIESEKAALKEEFEKIDKIYQKYRQQVQQVNKTIQPFNEQDEWVSKGAVEKGLLQCLTAIGKLAPQLGIEIDVAKAAKVLNQISPIAQGVASWVVMAQSEIKDWLDRQLITEQEKQWLVTCALPYVYWQIQFNRTQAKLRNQDLRAYYKRRVEKAKQRSLSDSLTISMNIDRQEELLLMAHRLAMSFQRASSQTEGRNGYLAFVNHAHRGIPKQRLKVLTVIHNFDIQRADGTTPAQRLFDKQFPDLFEFLCQNVTGFKEPRRRNRKALRFNNLQH